MSKRVIFNPMIFNLQLKGAFANFIVWKLKLETQYFLYWPYVTWCLKKGIFDRNFIWHIDSHSSKYSSKLKLMYKIE